MKCACIWLSVTRTDSWWKKAQRSLSLIHISSLLGDYLPAKLGMDAGENVVFLCLPGDYSGALLVFFEDVYKRQAL